METPPSPGAPLRRDPRLRALSSDHHNALLLARRALEAAAGRRDPAATWAEVTARFAAELAPHFAVEESTLLPALEARGEVDLVRRTLADHAALRGCLIDQETPLAERLRGFGERLTDHVRFEERALFPAAQERLSPAELTAVAAAAEAVPRTCARGP